MTTLHAERTALRPLSAAAEARQAARTLLAALGRPAIGRERADTVILSVSELVTNTLRLAAHPGAVEVAVADHSPRLPRAQTPDLVDGTGGFGWHMVNDLAHHVTVTPGPHGGKTIHAFLPR
ncbi:ATP-binding protein [Streptomyces sp. NPDC002886]|uniref:ATP-binding protein n=1 Tax=Streptomyces sp. NPDC002886 TaxID=3364667 RepID=UPI00367B8D29